MSFFVHHRTFLACKKSAKKVRKFATKIASRQNSVNQYFGWRTWCFGWRILLIDMVYVVFLLAYSFDGDGVCGVLVGALGVLVGVLF